MKPIILFADANDESFAALPDAAREAFDLRLATSYEEASTLLSGKEEVAVLVTELDLGEEDGVAFLANARKIAPDTVRIVLSRKAEFQNAADALNKGWAFHYLTKPCPDDELLRTLAKAARRHHEKREEKHSARKSLLGSVKALVDILDMVSPEAVGHSKRIRGRVMAVGKALGVKPLWQLELAVMLSHIGCVALPPAIMKKLDRGDSLSPEEQQIFGTHPNIASSLLANIEQMKRVAEIIRCQRLPLDEKQPMESRIIKVALDLDRMERKGAQPEAILQRMFEKDTYDPKVVAAMQTLCAEAADSGTETKTATGPSREISVEDLEEGMVMAEDMVNKDGTRLLLRGQTVTKASKIRLQAFAEALGVMEPIVVQTSS